MRSALVVSLRQHDLPIRGLGVHHGYFMIVLLDTMLLMLDSIRVGCIRKVIAFKLVLMDVVVASILR